MKSTLFVLSLLVAALVVGCMEQSITDPIGATASQGSQLAKPHPVNTLALNAILHVPGNVYNSFLEISGTVAYQATVVALDPIPANPQYAVRLNLTANAQVRPYDPSVPPLLPVWYVSGTSEDWVPIPASGAAFVTNRRPIEGRSDGMMLNLEFRITLTSVELSSMWLELPRVLRVENSN